MSRNVNEFLCLSVFGNVFHDGECDNSESHNGQLAHILEWVQM